MIGVNLPRPRSAEQMAEARTMLVPFVRAGYRLVLLSTTAKIPIEKGWQKNDYTKKIRPWLERGGNIGILLGDTDLVLDVDPRNGGLKSLARMEDDLDIDLSSAPAVLSGRDDGGRHIYMKKDAGIRVRKAMEKFPGLDVKTKGGFVVGPASRHPTTGGLYRPDAAAPSITEVTSAPAVLLEALRRPDTKPRVTTGGGELTNDDLALALSALDPHEYGQGAYDRWIRLAAACHDATNGDGIETWLDWAAQDEEYAAEVDGDRNVAAWESFKAGRPGGANYLTLLWEVARAGRPDIARRLEPGIRFDVSTPLDAPDHSLSFNMED